MLFIASFIEHFIPKNLALLQNIDFFGWLLPAVWGFWSKAVALPRSKSLRLSEGHSFDPGILQPARKDTKRRLWEWVNALWVVEKYGESLIIPVQAQPVNLKRKSTQNPLCKTFDSNINNLKPEFSFSLMQFSPRICWGKACMQISPHLNN